LTTDNGQRSNVSNDRSTVELFQLLAKGEIFTEHLVHEHLKAIRRLDPTIKAFLHVDEESAPAQAKQIDARRRRGEPLGALAGLPIAVKDVLCMAGKPTTCGSKMLRNF